MRVVLLVVLAGCFDPKFNNPACGPEGQCPSGLMCIAGTCRMPIDGGIDVIDAPPDTIDAPPGSMTLTFQQGMNLYTSARDTYIASGDSTPNDGEPMVRWKLDDRTGLLAFDAIIGPGAIPASATIVSATLTLVISNDNATGMIYESAVAWTTAVTFDTFGPAAGVQPGDLGAPLGATPSQGTHSFDVKAALERWVANPSTNHGWVFLATGGGGDGAFRSSDEQLANRPRLSVTFYP